MRVWAVKSFQQQWKKKNNPASKQCFDEFPQGTAGNGASDTQDWAQKPAPSDLSAVLQQDSVGLASPGWGHAGALQPAEVAHCLEIHFRFGVLSLK